MTSLDQRNAATADGVGDVFASGDAELLKPRGRKRRSNPLSPLLTLARTKDGGMAVAAVAASLTLLVGAFGFQDQLSKTITIAAVALVALFIVVQLPNPAYRLATIPLVGSFVAPGEWQMVSVICLTIILAAGIIVEAIKTIASSDDLS